ncbi:Hypothetical_protein [Hexamita inflata]|uniref:Hypothetical_protein n=1 Tax=Hexamita inflata TaxID=28002 RepID=A0AA86U1H4_9EUKA|nr:Hypothetical protein HINF_LOCUS15303 [Hexamita inflata]
MQFSDSQANKTEQETQQYDEMPIQSMFFNADVFDNTFTQSEPISNALIRKADQCVQDLSDILTKCDIPADTLGVFEREANRARLYEKLPVVAPSRIYKQLLDIRVVYEVYLHVCGQKLIQQRVFFPDLCQAINDGLFRPRGSYPLLMSWQIEQPTQQKVTSQAYFLTPQQAAYMSLTQYENEYFAAVQFDRTKAELDCSRLVQNILQKSFFDSSKHTQMIRNSHPLQNLSSLVYKYPEIILLLGQKVPSVTQRIGLFTGYLKQFEQKMINTLHEDINVAQMDILPEKSLIQSPFTRLIFTGIIKSLITHENDLAQWPASYCYQPDSKQVKEYFLADFLFAICGQQSMIDWAKDVLYDFVQVLLSERVINVFQLLCMQSKEGIQYLKPVLKVLAQRILSKLESIPDVAKTTLTIAQFAIRNLISNVANKLFQQPDTQLSQALSSRFPEIADLIDPLNQKLTNQRIQGLIQRLFKQFTGQLIFGQLIRTALNNPVSFLLIQPSQAHLPQIEVFYSNLSLIGDLLAESFIEISYLDYQLNKQCVKNTVLNQQQTYCFRNNYDSIKEFYTELQSIYEYLNFQFITYELKPEQVKNLIQQTEYKVNSMDLTGGYWVGTCAYFCDLHQIFKENTQYLNKNFEILQRNCQDILQQVFITTDQIADDQDFSSDIKFSLYNNVNNLISRVDSLVTPDKVAEFVKMTRTESGVVGGVTFLPIFDDCLLEQKHFELNLNQSRCLDQLIQRHKQSVQEQEVFSQILARGDNLELQMAQANVSEDIKSFYVHCDQLLDLFTLLRRINNFKQQLQRLDTQDEELYFSQISAHQTELTSLTNLTQQTIQSVQHHTDQIQQRKTEKTVLDELQKIILLQLDQLNKNNEFTDNELIEREIDEEQQMNQFNLYQELENEFKLSRNAQILEELVFQHTQYKIKLQQDYTRVQKWAPTSTLEKVFGKPIQFFEIKSEAFKKLFQDKIQDDSEIERMAQMDAAFGEFGEGVRESLDD